MNPYRILHLMILSALLIAGCGTELDNNGDGSDGGSGRELGEASTFTATIESSGATKTLLTGRAGGTRPVLWAADDSVRIGRAPYNVSQISADTLVATFSAAGTATAQKQGGLYKAYYPASLYNGGTPTLPQVQMYGGTKTFSSTRKYPIIANLPMYAESSTDRLDFKNLCAVLHFSLTGSDKVTSVVVESATKALWGPFTVTNHAAVLSSSLNAVAANREVTLNCGTGGVQLDTTTPTDFFVAVPPAAYSANDLTIRFYNGTALVASLRNIQATMALARNQIYQIGKDTDTYESMRLVVRSTASERTFVLPFFQDYLFPTDLLIDWGDADHTVTTLLAGTAASEALCTFTYKAADAGEHTITITSRAAATYMADATKPRIPRFAFGDSRSVPTANDALKTSSQKMVVKVLDPLLRYSNGSGRQIYQNLVNLTEVCGKLFSKNPQFTDMQSVFENCSSLTAVPADIFEGIPNAQNFYRAFAASGLRSLPEGIFSSLKDARSFQTCFYQCTDLTTIPAGLFKGLNKVENFWSTFNASGLTNLPADTFEGCTGVTSFRQTFTNCSSLVGPIPQGLFDDCTANENFSATFQGCTALTGSIPAGLFAGMTKATTFEGTFRNCASLTGRIPAELFKDCSEVESFAYTFAGSCDYSTYTVENDPGAMHLTGPIPADLFANCRKVTNFERTFYMCTRLTGAIPSGLFRNNAAVVSFAHTFRQCINLTGEIPEDLFANCPDVESLYCCFSGEGGGGLPGTYRMKLELGNNLGRLLRNMKKLQTVRYAFAWCDFTIDEVPVTTFRNNPEITDFTLVFHNTGLKRVPEDLFRYNTKAESFSRAFRGCALESIPEKLFWYNTEVTDMSSVFGNSLTTTSGVFVPESTASHTFTTVPQDLFKNNTKVTNFGNLFAGCTRLQTVPDGLFAYNTKVVSFARAFANCRNLRMNPSIFIKTGVNSASTRFASQTVDFTRCFYDVGADLSDAGTAPALWSYTFGSTPTIEECFANTWNKYTNAASIPAAWK